MEKLPSGPWYVKKVIGQMVSIVGADSSVIAVLPEGGNGVGLNITEAYLLAVAPQLFDV